MPDHCKGYPGVWKGYAEIEYKLGLPAENKAKVAIEIFENTLPKFYVAGPFNSLVWKHGLVCDIEKQGNAVEKIF
jgi:hypothetical protein